MLTHLFASAGLFTGMLEVVATSIGFGTVVGGFIAGLADLVAGHPRARSERSVVTGGYVGGLLGLLLLTIDIVGRRFV